MDIQIEHMNQRLFFIQAMFCMSLYNWYNYSLFDTINNSFFHSILSKLYVNVILFRLGYISYDYQPYII